MKIITVKGRTIFRSKKGGEVVRQTFEKGCPYEVEDAVAASPFMKARLASCETPKVKKAAKAKEAKDDSAAASAADS